VSNLSIQSMATPPGGERRGVMAHVTRLINRGRTGWEGAEREGMERPDLKKVPLRGTRASKTTASMRLCSPGLFAGLKDNGRGPTADGESAGRATPEPVQPPCQGSVEWSPRPDQGQRTRRTRGRDAPPGSLGKPGTGGRGRDIPNLAKVTITPARSSID
jgi:hypothetical protein